MKRSATIYEAAGMITTTDAKAMIALANELRKRVESWLRSTHPDLL